MQGGDLALGVLESIPFLTHGTEGHRSWPSGKKGLAGSLREQDLQRKGRLSNPLTIWKSLATRVCAWFHTVVVWWAVSQGSIPPAGSSSDRRKGGSDKRTVLGIRWLDNLFTASGLRLVSPTTETEPHMAAGTWHSLTTRGKILVVGTPGSSKNAIDSPAAQTYKELGTGEGIAQGRRRLLVLI